MKAAKEQEDKNIKQFSNGQSKRLDRNVRQTCIMVAIGIYYFLYLLVVI